MAVAVAAESAAPSRQRIEGSVESQSVRSDSVPDSPVDSAAAVRRRGGRINKGAGVESGDSAVIAAMRGGEADSSGTAGRQRLTRLNREKVDLEDIWTVREVVVKYTTDLPADRDVLFSE